MADVPFPRWQTDGKFFRSGSQRVWMKAVTYGPFPGGWPERFESDFSRMAAAGFNALRLYEMPPVELLDVAHIYGLRVFAGLRWAQNLNFISCPAIESAAKVKLDMALREIGDHPALTGVYVGNEIPSDLVRWMGPVRVRETIESLIALGKEIHPSLLFAYANYPSTEYLEPANADFTAFNVYLEKETAFQSYLRRLHHIAGDRPLVISEFGLDSLRNGLESQAVTLAWALQQAHDGETAGMTIYAWSDRWWNAGAAVLDWDFGLIDRLGNPKPSLNSVSQSPMSTAPTSAPLVSVIVCTRNGIERIANCLEALGRQSDSNFEVIVVDDGSTDETSLHVSQSFPWVRIISSEPVGLSAARNAGAAVANGEIFAFTDDDCEPDFEWISRIRPILSSGDFDAACGPNLSPPPRGVEEAVVCAAPGAPSHVMLDDVEAEHLPGCNLVVTRAAFSAVGGFDPQFQTAGDDVDFCWRLRDHGFRLGFVPGAFVWHRRRTSLIGFLRQQRGYGKAEKLLIAKHPNRFSHSGETQWQGVIYGGGAITVTRGSIIYYGSMGSASYQSISTRMLPIRPLDPTYANEFSGLTLRVIQFLQPHLRAWSRSRRLAHFTPKHDAVPTNHSMEFRRPMAASESRESVLNEYLANGWQAAGPCAEWDLEKNDCRLLLAVERGDLDYAELLTRVWHLSSEVYGVNTRAGLL